MGNFCLSCLSGTFHTVDRWCHVSYLWSSITGRPRDGLYEPVLADSEREAVADLLQYLENVSAIYKSLSSDVCVQDANHRDVQRAETDFFAGEPLRALSTLVYSDNVDLQRSASLTFAEITERGGFWLVSACDAILIAV